MASIKKLKNDSSRDWSQKWDLDGNGFVLLMGGQPLNMDKMRKEWLMGGVFSIKFN